MATKRKYQWRPDRPDFRDFKFAISPSALAAVPPKVDLRPQCPPIWDQGQLGCCVDEAVGSAYEFDLRKLNPRSDFLPSVLFLYYIVRVDQGTVNSDSGSSIREGAKMLNKQGICHETLWPFRPSKFRSKPPQVAYQDAARHKCVKYSSVPQVLTNIQAVIAGGLPVVFGFSVFDSFESDVVTRTGVVPMPAATESFLGGHATCLVGYDNSAQRFLVRNSWGTGWGMAGYFTMPYAYVLSSGLSSDFWVIQQVS